MKTYDLVLGLPCFKARTPEIDWTKGRLTALQMPNGPQWSKSPEADHATSLLKCGKGNPNGHLTPDMQLLGATAFDHLVAGGQVVEGFTIRVRECQWFLESSLEGITKGEGNTRILNVRAGAMAGVVAEEWHTDAAWMTATGSLRY